MSTLLSKVANALTFAHLTGLGRAAAETPPDDEKKDDKPAAAAEDEDPKKKRDDETAEEYAARIEAMPEDEEKKDDKTASAPSADALAAARAEGVAEGRRMERERGAAVFGHKAAGNNIALAAELTFGSDMSAERITGVLAKTNPPSMATRASRNPTIGVGQVQTDSNSPGAVSNSWDRAFAKANPGRRQPQR